MMVLVGVIVCVASGDAPGVFVVEGVIVFVGVSVGVIV